MLYVKCMFLQPFQQSQKYYNIIINANCFLLLNVQDQKTQLCMRKVYVFAPVRTVAKI